MKTLALIVGCLLFAAVLAKEIPEDQENENEVEPRIDPCAKKNCKHGYQCVLDEDSKPSCVCIKKCPDELDPRSQVCSTKNETFTSECELYRQKCECRNGGECSKKQHKYAHLDYYGECKAMPPCTEEEMKDFPDRMSTWLFYVMEQLNERGDLSKSEKKMAEKAKTMTNKRTIPVIWEFCSLDKSNDKMINTHELLPISAPIKPLEHCFAPFLNKCDTNGKGGITFEEWGTCLGLEKDEIMDLKDLCTELRE